MKPRSRSRFDAGWRAFSAAPVMAAGFLVLPIPLPTPTQLLPSPPAVPSVLPTALPTLLASPSLPVSVSPSLPVNVPTSNPVTGATAPAATAPAAQGGGGHSNPSGAGTRTVAPQPPPRGISIPFTAIVISSPLDLALIGALITLPLLFAIWLLLFGRTFAEARRSREAHLRLTLAADLGLRPRELTSMSTKALFELRDKAAFDELTGVLRRAAGISAAEHEIARSRRNNSPLTIAFVDVDGLKEANDREGHAAGDALLRSLTTSLKDGLRSQDLVFRYGGDEFVCLLPDTMIKAAREKLGSIQVDATKSGVRFCFGLAQLERADDVVSLFARADRELYEFKEGRGEIVQLPPPGERPVRPPVPSHSLRA